MFNKIIKLYYFLPAKGKVGQDLIGEKNWAAGLKKSDVLSLTSDVSLLNLLRPPPLPIILLHYIPQCPNQNNIKRVQNNLQWIKSK